MQRSLGVITAGKYVLTHFNNADLEEGFLCQERGCMGSLCVLFGFVVILKLLYRKVYK